MRLFLTRVVLLLSMLLLAGSALAAAGKADAQKTNRAATAKCANCNRVQTAKKKPQPCHPKSYVDPKISKNYNQAMRDMKRAGIAPKVTSAWRSSTHQASLHKCSNSRACRKRNPGLYYAMPAGASAHEAGLAVDISGVAAGPRGAKRLTPRGRKIVRIMEKNGFNWRYGLKDPAHFEVSPKRAGYKNLKQAIQKTQNSCSLRPAKKKKR